MRQARVKRRGREKEKEQKRGREADAGLIDVAFIISSEIV